MPGNEIEQQSNQQQLASMLPEVATLEKSEQIELHALMRRTILLERKKEQEAENIFRPEDTQTLKKMISCLSINTEEQIQNYIEELGLEGEEAEMESSNWAFRHQSVNGDMLIGEALYLFKIVRVSEFQFVLLVEQANKEIMQAFIPVFEKKPDIQLENAIQTDSGAWTGWVWITDPDDVRTAVVKEQIKSMWEGHRNEIQNNS